MASFFKCKLQLNGKWKEAPQSFCESLGYDRETLEQLTLAKIIHKNDRRKVTKFFDTVSEDNFPEFDTEAKFLTKPGHYLHVHISLTGIKNKTGSLEYVLAHIYNLSQQKELHQKWQTVKQQFESLFNHNPLPVYYYDLEGNFLDANEKLTDFTGLSHDQIIGMHFSNFIKGKDLERAKEQFNKAVNGKAGQYEIQVVVKDGVQKNIRVTKFPMYMGEEITGVYGIFEDITNQKRIEKELQESEQLFKSLFTHNPYPAMRFDLEGNFMDANEKTVEMAGYSKEELLESGFSFFIAEEDIEEVSKYFEKAASGEPQYYEVKGHTKNEVLHIESSLSPIYVNNEIIGLFCIAKDITQQKKAEQKLKESEQRWQQLVEYNPQPVMIVQERKIVFINQVGANYFGASSVEELIGKHATEFSHQDSLELAKERQNKLEQNEILGSGEFKIVLLNGETREVEAHSIPITYKGKPAIQTVIHDISDLKEKQRIIGKSLKEKETLLQEIHHRVKNNLAVISGLLELQQMSITDEDTIQALQDSQLRIQSMAMIHEKLYQSESLHEIGFDAYLKELIDSINSSYESSYKKVYTNYKLDHVTLDLNQAIPCSLIINEVIVNCYKHAFDKDHEGKIDIILTHKNPEVTLKITDNGNGLPKDFDISEQQSLGTTLISSLSHQLNGHMILTNRGNGNGTKFMLQFKKDSTEF